MRRSLGVSETAKTEELVKPAPPVETETETAQVEESDKPGIILPDHMKDKVRISRIYIFYMFHSLMNNTRSRLKWRK